MGGWNLLVGSDLKPIIHFLIHGLRGLDSGLKANVSEAEHPLLCEGTRRQKGELAITMLVHYKDDPAKLARVGTCRCCSFKLFHFKRLQFNYFTYPHACLPVILM